MHHSLFFVDDAKKGEVPLSRADNRKALCSNGIAPAVFKGIQVSPLAELRDVYFLGAVAGNGIALQQNGPPDRVENAQLVLACGKIEELETRIDYGRIGIDKYIGAKRRQQRGLFRIKYFERHVRDGIS